MSKIKEYKSKQFPNEILQVHIIENLYTKRCMYRFIKKEFDVGEVFLNVMGYKTKNEFKDIEEAKLNRQLKEYGWKQIKRKRQ